MELNWTKLGADLRRSADDAHNDETPGFEIAYAFMLENPECFGFQDWPADMPALPPLELIAAYYRAFESEVIQ